MPHQFDEPFVLLIDDDNARRESFSRRLEAIGIPTVSAPRVLIALDCLAEKDSIHLVLIDEDIAEETGFRTLIQVTRTSSTRPRTIMLMSDMARRTRYQNCGVHYYARRPADIRAAAALLDLALDGFDASPGLGLTG